MMSSTKHITESIKYCKASRRELLKQMPNGFDLDNYEANDALLTAERWLNEVRDNTKAGAKDA